MPERNAAERQIARFEEGATLEQIYAEQVRGARPWLTSRSPSSELLEALAQLKVSDLLVQTLSTVSSLAYHRLSEEHRDLEQVRLAIEALRALLPVLSASLPPELLRDFEQVTANLQLAYAGRSRTRLLNRARPTPCDT